ncbi:Uma2 family endonuclease [Streptomyces sp. G45]|uniref:Uma2 family endonuclease n=1 Tax=Streptomyces sp. G45 TaxID=3406627 RepID=UPI003C17F8CA
MTAEAGAERQARGGIENWMCPPLDGWTWEEVQELDAPFDWDLVDGAVVVRGAARVWHQLVRDQMRFELGLPGRAPYAVNGGQWVALDERNVLRPDVIAFDSTGLDVTALTAVPAANVVLAVEIVSPGSRNSDYFLKPGMYAEAGIASYWRVERGEDSVPVVHEFWRHHETSTLPAPNSPPTPAS